MVSLSTPPFPNNLTAGLLLRLQIRCHSFIPVMSSHWTGVYLLVTLFTGVCECAVAGKKVCVTETRHQTDSHQTESLSSHSKSDSTGRRNGIGRERKGECTGKGRGLFRNFKQGREAEAGSDMPRNQAECGCACAHPPLWFSICVFALFKGCFRGKGGKQFHESMNLTAVVVFSRTAHPTHPACTLLDTHLPLFHESPDGQLQIEIPP